MAMYYEAWESLARRSGESSGVIEALVSVDPYIGSLLVLSVKTHGLTALLTHSVCPAALRISKLTHEHTLGGCAWNLGRLSMARYDTSTISRIGLTDTTQAE